MKKILIPFDFSESSRSALNYAAILAMDAGSELSLLCVNEYPVTSPDMGLSAFSYSDAKEECLKELMKISEEIKPQAPGIQISCFSEMGQVTDEIEKHCSKNHIDLVIMGISGHGNKLVETLAGSSAVQLSRHTTLPVLIIPPGLVYKKPTRIAYACKYTDEGNYQPTTEKIKNLFSHFSPDIHVIHIVPEDHPIKHTEVVIDNYMDHKLEESVHRTFIMTEKNVSEGLLGVLNNNVVDIIVLEPKKHNFFENLFHHSVTSDIAFNSPVPVMTIHN